MSFLRRDFLKASAAGSLMVGISGWAGPMAFAAGRAKAHIVVIGGGFGGATVAKYLRLWSRGRVEVTLVERSLNFVSCPISNLVLGGVKSMADITFGYRGLKKHGVRVIQGEVTGIDAEQRQVHLADGQSLSYDRLVLSPGIDFMYDSVPGLMPEIAESGMIPHAWKAGAQTVALKKQLEDMHDGGTFAICIPKAPFRCQPGPYERACMVAHYFKQHKPKSKLLILDANDEPAAKKDLFKKAWAELYPEIIEYRHRHTITGVDSARRRVEFEFDEPVTADVLNIIPAQQAGQLAKPFINKNGRWAGVDWLSLESEVAPNIHVIGDATFAAPGMPKSGHMTNQQAKVAAAAILNLLAEQPVNPEPMMVNTCYSFVDAENAVHVVSVHAWNAQEKTFKIVPGSGGLSVAPSKEEAKYALAWAKNIWADVLT
ncbi:MAG: FCSD flavin-binding domain-containing protein [Rhodocyclales bacterium]|nr:FCSD flavin-binding domain-containing protein [Rhodocyclales bacterium]